MALRILLFGIGLLLGYAGKRWSAKRGTWAPTFPQAVAGGCVFLVVCWAAWQLVAWLFFLPRNLLHYAPIDALVVGMAAGWILADHQADAEQPGPNVRQAPSTGGPREDAAMSAGSARKTPESSRPDLQWLAPLTSAARTTVTSLGLLILALLGLAPPHFWGQIFERLEGFKAAGLELNFGTAAGQDVAQSISASATVPDISGRTKPEDRHGFVRQRLDRMRSLTHPYEATESGQALLDTNATALLYAQATDVLRPTRTHREQDAGQIYEMPRDVLRDRALLLHLHLGAAATDTRVHHTRIREAERRSPGLISDLNGVASAQGELLARFAPHVACVAEVISETNDRRLLEYQTLGVVEDLYHVARLWSSLEKVHTFRHLTGAVLPVAVARDIDTAEDELREHAKRLSSRLRKFTRWADGTIGAWRAARSVSEFKPLPPSPGVLAIAANDQTGRPVLQAVGPSRALGTLDDATGGNEEHFSATGGGPPGERPSASPRHPKAPQSKHCDFGPTNVAAPERYIVRALLPPEPGGQSELEKGSFTPYLTIFVAQALSAMGDHRAALRLLVTWQNDLRDLIGIAKDDSAVWSKVDPDARAALRLGLRLARRTEQFLLNSEWFELIAFAETLILQNLSEHTELGLPATEQGTHHLVTRLFPAVFARISQDTKLPEWRSSAAPDWRIAWAKDCRDASHAWRQTLTLSYATWVKAYLDLRNKNLIQPDDITTTDVEFADLINELNLECFPSELKPRDFGRQRAEFALTGVAIKLNLIVTQRLGSDSRQDLKQTLQASVRRTLSDLQRSKLEGGGANDLERMVFEREDALLSSAKSIKARLDAFAAR